MPPKRIRLTLDKTQKKLSFGNTESRTEKDGEGEDTQSNSMEVEEDGTSTDKDKRKFQPSWLKLWSWLEFRDDGAMYCKVCIKHGKKNAMTSGCKTFKTSTMKRHETFDDHKSAIQAEELKVNFDAAVAASFKEEDKAVIKALKVVYWMASENLPMSKYESLMNLLKELEVPDIGNLKVSETVNYESYYTANELLEAISSQIDEEVDKKLEISPVLTVLADESTDIGNKQRMTIHARIVDPVTSAPETIYLRDVEYEDGTGEGLAEEIMKEVKTRNIPTSKMLGMGSDGTSVMSGKNKGVQGRLLEHNAHLVHVHCMAHRLALCTSQASEKISQLKSYQEWLTTLYYYFKKSACREKELHNIQEVLNSPDLKYKEIHAVRWLSCYQAVEAVYRTLDPLITYFHQRKAEDDPKAKGLLKSIATNKFIYITYLMMDVLAIVTRLCLQFQAKDLDIAKAKLSIDNCLRDLNDYRNGKQKFKTHLEDYTKDISKVGSHLEVNGHIIANKLTEQSAIALKNEFIDHLIVNINDRFPQKSLINSFYVLGMRTINFEADPSSFGNKEIEDLLKHYGEKKTHKSKVSPPVVSKAAVRTEWQAAKNAVRALKYQLKTWQIFGIFSLCIMGKSCQISSNLHNYA